MALTFAPQASSTLTANEYGAHVGEESKRRQTCAGLFQRRTIQRKKFFVFYIAREKFSPLLQRGVDMLSGLENMCIKRLFVVRIPSILPSDPCTSSILE